MKDFWKNQWDLFKVDMDNFSKFWTQPITFKKEATLELKPAVEEIAEKKEEPGFWKKQWSLFEEEYDSFLNYITEPIHFFK